MSKTRYSVTLTLSLSLSLSLLGASIANAQQVETGLSKDTIRVGDPFRVVLRIALPKGEDLTLPDSLSATEDIENSGRVRMKRDTATDGMVISAAYPITAWRPGKLALPDLSAVLKTATGERKIAIKLPEIAVLSVLPADTTNIQAKPPKDVIGKNRLWWPWLIALLALAVALALAYWWWRRRKKPDELAPIAAILPRDRALEELERIRKLGLVQEGLYKRHYTLVAEVMRRYMATVEQPWGTDLTTEELARKVRGRPEIAPAISMLRHSDLVKFADQQPTANDASRIVDSAKDWIASYPPPPPPAIEEQAA